MSIHVLDPNLSSRKANYILQSGLASLALVAILLVEDVVLRAAIVVAVASSAFTVFVVPQSVAASPRKVVGGHFVGVLAGTAVSSLLLIPILGTAVEESRILFDLMAALSVGLGTFGMVATNTEHPPAAGTALGLVVHGWDWSAVVFVMTAVTTLSIIHLALRPRLINLL